MGSRRWNDWPLVVPHLQHTINGRPKWFLQTEPALVGEGSMLSRTDRARLVKLLGVPRSDDADERDNAALAIERLRRDSGVSWERIFGIS